MKRSFFILLLALFVNGVHSQQVTFRGVNHCGIYSNEKNLLTQWPAEGPWAGGKGRGALIVADNMFYMFDERHGTVGLARINPEKLDVVSEFRITDGSGACFSHPTIFYGVLYVRHGTALIAYNIKK